MFKHPTLNLFYHMHYVLGWTGSQTRRVASKKGTCD